MKTLLIIIALCSTCLLLAQDVSLESSTEQVDSVKFSKLLRSYREIAMIEREETTLIKVDLLGPALYLMSEIDTTKHNLIRLTYESKFKPEWSWLLSFEGQVNKEEFTELRYRGGVRYYFNMNKRILKGKSANNFSANYLSVRANYKRRPPDSDNQLSLDLLFGIQRRLWKYGYVDFDIGLENIIAPFDTNTAGVDFTASIQLGIAF